MLTDGVPLLRWRDVQEAPPINWTAASMPEAVNCCPLGSSNQEADWRRCAKYNIAATNFTEKYTSFSVCWSHPDGW